MYEFNLNSIGTYLGPLPVAVATTLWLSAQAIALSMVVGIFGALCRQSESLALRVFGGIYVELLRNVPLLVVIYLVFFGLAQIGIRIDNFHSALIALTLNAGAYMTEVFRGGLVTIPRGQYLAAFALGMTRYQAYRYAL